MTSPAAAFERPRKVPWALGGTILAWAAAVALTVLPALVIGTSFDAYRIVYLPFLLTWIGLDAGLIFTVRHINGWTEKSHFALVAVALFVLIYYGIGRPMEWLVLRSQAPLGGASFNPVEEMVVPLAVGVGLWAIFVAAWRLADSYRARRRRTPSDAPGWRSVLPMATSVFLTIGFLLWANSALAWVIVSFFGGWDPVVTSPWVRFASEADPANLFWQVGAWPAAVLVCCG